MKYELRPLTVADADKLYDFYQTIPACKMSESVGGKLESDVFNERRGRFIRKYSFNTSKLD